MFRFSSGPSKVLPKNFRGVAEKLFPHSRGKSSSIPSLDAAKNFARELGIGEDYKDLLKERDMNEFLERFQNNLDLLIQKTWVEKADEDRKNALLDKIPPLISLIENEKYPEALKEFGIILEELAYLFFGSQSQKDDFTEYTFRIDLEMGLFWWYGSMLGRSQNLDWTLKANREVQLSVLLLGICYLTNF